MSGLTFLFSAALWALPLAGLPVLLHLLFRRKTVVVPFPTLRFVRASIQQTAARKKVHRWLLLLLRTAALLALIAAVSQPAIKPDAAPSGQGGRSAAVIVVDTSYSMQWADGGTRVAARAEQAVRELLDGRLRGTRVAILRSRPAAAEASDSPSRPDAAELRLEEAFRDSASVRRTTAEPQPAPRPLVDRVQHAARMLAGEDVDERWLFVVSDFQSREFPQPLPESSNVRLVAIDLRPDPAPWAAVTSIHLNPEQPTAGLAGEAVVDLVGTPGDTRQVNLSTQLLDREGGTTFPPSPARFDDRGHARVRIPLVTPPAGFFAIEASTPLDEPLAWAKARQLLVQIPPRQNVSVLASADLGDVARRVSLALDPAAGQSADWPLTVRLAEDIPADADVIVAVLSDWPGLERAGQLRRIAAEGRTVILFARPGLEQTWAGLPQDRRDALLSILPGIPSASVRPASLYTTTVLAPADPVLAGLTDDRFEIRSITARRLLPFDTLVPGVVPILGVDDARGDGALRDGALGDGVLGDGVLGDGGGRRPAGLLFRRQVGGGRVFTFCSLPDKRYGSLHLHPTFPPMLVQMSLRPPARSAAQNVELGGDLFIDAPDVLQYPELRLEGPGGEVTAVRPTDVDGARAFRYGQADRAGVYTWRNPADDRPVALSNVLYPAAEAEPAYTPVAQLLRADTSAVVARSTEELIDRLSAARQPQPRWSWLLAGVLVLLCFEALLGSLARPAVRTAPPAPMR